MAQTKRDTVRLKGTTISAKVPGKKTVVTRQGEVPARKVDSLKRAGYAKAIGSGYKGSGGKTTYGDDASDAIKAGLSRKKRS